MKGVARFMLTVLALDGSSYGYLWVLESDLSAKKTASGTRDSLDDNSCIRAARGRGQLTRRASQIKILIEQMNWTCLN